MFKKLLSAIAAFSAGFYSFYLEAKTVRSYSFFPAAGDRSAWEQLLATPRGKAIYAGVVQEAEKLLSRPVPQLTAELFMRFKRNGNRIDYEKVYFDRRHNLHTLVLAECFEYKGRFTDKIIDYLWDICSEYTWCLPAHTRTGTEDPLPYLKHEQIDLFASSTGLDLTLVLTSLENELAKVSPSIVKIVQKNLLTRIVEPLEIRPFPFHWIQKKNNWRPWCCRNCLAPVLYILKDQPKRRAAIVNFFKAAIKDYINIYPEDGCCDEGPSYWGVNPVMLLGFYEMLNEMPEDTRKYALMADYILHARLTTKYFAGFADAVVTTRSISGAACYRFGERTGNPDLKALGAAYSRMSFQRSSSLFDHMCNLFWLPSATGETLKEKSSQLKYYDKLQMLYFKDRGIALAAKRGHRGSHYHMDIGQFIIFYKDAPVAIDLGATVYTRDTFSEKRFNNWIINSEAHNIPQFNGVTQLKDPKPAPGAAELIRNDDKLIFHMDLTSAYPEEAQLVKCERIITYDFRDQSIEVEDKWELKRDDNQIRVPLYTPSPIAVEGERIQISGMELSISGDNSDVKVVPMTMTDDKVIAAWGTLINRLDIVTVSGKKGSRKMRFAPVKK